MALEVLNGPTIAAGESSERRRRLPCRQDRSKSPCRRIGRTPTHLSDLSDGMAYNDIMRPDGHEVMCVVFAGDRHHRHGAVTGFLEFRSGTRDRPVEQEEIRTFAVAIDTGAA